MTQEEREQAARVLDILADRLQYFASTDAVNALEAAIAALRPPVWIKTSAHLPEGDEHDEVLSLYKGTDYLLYDIVQVGWLRLHPEMHVYWTRMPQKPEVEE